MRGVALWAAVLLGAAPPPQVALPADVDVEGGFSVPAATGVEAQLMEDARDGTLNQVDFVDGALLASGVTAAQLPVWRARLVTALEPVRNRARAATAEPSRGRALLVALHETLLRRYVADASSLTRTLETGEFNCLSSAVLYVMAAQGLVPQPRAMIGLVHAFARVTVEGRAVDVETTLPAGFDPNRATLFTADTVKRLGFSDAAGGAADMGQQAAQAVELPPVALLAGLYSNRVVELLQHGDVKHAAVALDRAAQLGQGPQKARLTAWRGALMANASRALLLQGQPRDAIPLLKMGLQGATGQTRTVLAHNLAVAWQQLAQQALEGHDVADALRLLDNADAAEPGTRTVAEIRAAALTQKAAQTADITTCKPVTDPAARAECLASVSGTLLQREQRQDAVAVARLALEDAKPMNARIAAWNALNARAAERAREGRCTDAAADWTEAEEFRDLAPQSTALMTKVASCWATAGNKAASQQKWEDARRSLERVLLYTPDDVEAKENLAAANTNQAIVLAAAGRCDDARPLLAQAARVFPARAEKARKVMVSCAHQRALAAFERQDFTTSAQEARRGLRDVPGSPELTQMLVAALYNKAREHSQQKDCPAARTVAEELRSLGAADKAAIILAACPP